MRITAFLTALLTAATSLAEPRPRYFEVTEAAGLPSTRAVPFFTNYASAALWLDWNRDGWPDLLIGELPGTARLFVNRADGTGFVEESDPVLSSLPNVLAFDHLTDVAVADGDGAPVVASGFVAVASEDGRERLVAFVDVGGVWRAVPVASPAQGLSTVNHGDLDGDGAPELFVTHDVCGMGAAPLATLHRLERRAGGYTSAFSTGELAGRFPAEGCWPLPFVTDPDGDGRLSLFVGGDFGSVDRVGYVIGPGGDGDLPAAYTMGFAAADRNDDGILDYLITSMGRDILWLSSPGGHVATATGADTEWGFDGPRFKWAASWLDADNDGDDELWAAAGLLPATFAVPDASSRDVFVVDGEDRADSVGVDLTTAERTLALADWNRDGRLDALLVGQDRLTLFENSATDAGHWVGLVGPLEPGTRMIVEACGRRYLREWSSGQAGAGHERLLHVGLGDCTTASVTLRYPWRPALALGPMEVDRYHSAPPPGRVWFEPGLVAPGSTVTLRSTLGGAVRVDVDGVLVEPGQSFTAPAELGDYRYAVRVDGAAIGLRPRLMVAEGGTELFVEPWPVRVGDRVVARVAPSGGDAIGVPAGTVSAPFTLRAGVGATGLDVTPIPRVDAARTVVEIEDQGDAIHVGALLADALGTSPVDEAGDPGEVIATSKDGAVTRVPLTTGLPGWASATVPAGTTSVSISAFGVTLATVSLAGPPGPMDPTRSRLWVVQPNLRADGQDIVEVVGWFADASGRVIAPGPELLPTADGLTRVDGAYRPAFEFDGRRAWSVRYVAGTTPGSFTIAAGDVAEAVRLLPAEHAPVDLAASELDFDGQNLVLVPRDRHGQRVGPGVTTTPPFTHVGNGTYVRPSPGDERVTLDEAGWLAWTDAGVERGTDLPSTEGGCSAGQGASERAPLGLLALFALGLWRLGRRRGLRAPFGKP